MRSDDYKSATHFHDRPRTVGHSANEQYTLNDLVAGRHMKLMKLNVLSIQNCCRSCKRQYMWCPLANDITIISIASFE